MTGRWILAAPNAPILRHEFRRCAGRAEGVVEPEGGCPGNFFTSRHWTLDKGALTINDQENQPLAHLTLADRRFEGQAAAGTPVTLSRSTITSIVRTAHGRIPALLLRPVRQRLSRRADAQSDRRRVGADLVSTSSARRRSARPSIATDVNEMGEVPVLVHGNKKLTQSGVILTYLANHSGKFKPQGEDEELESLRWIIFDNQKVNGFLGPFRFLKNFAKPAGDPAVMAFLQGRARRQRSRSSTSG